MFRSIAILCLLAHPAFAQSGLSAKDFEARVLGRTLDFGFQGQDPYGIERYLPDRRVLWSWGDGQCETGEWYVEGDNICFVYDFDPTPQCWRYFETSGRMMAVFMNDGEDSAVYELTPVKRELICNNFGM